ncbi:hypothetical protein HDU87_000913 [Geranomyces variabilis]|uniref:Uncharacterized protein n=1 Tax=Geranomyces variabilis TaxID=109894 RepID=A0AAD5XNN0_9FUNG|nr:hypothetical protein HDU87_000913 [Geranomyces variabilis]
MEPIPASRWNAKTWEGSIDEPAKVWMRKGGFVKDIDLFDPLEFGISVKEADNMDPSHRLAMEVAHQALLDSGLKYRGSDMGVFFAQLLNTKNEVPDSVYQSNALSAMGKCVTMRPNKISYVFDLSGPSLVVDTACSASGTAMHLASRAIAAGDCSAAMVVGANINVNPEVTVGFSKLGVLSQDSSKSFDSSANGYARAEAFAAVIVKPLDAALRDGDHIYSVISGSAVNANGKGTSVTMPEGKMQQQVMRAAYREANRSPADTLYVELHATGTLVGDPIESNAAGEVFLDASKTKTTRVGSVKANIGHAEGTSFLASLIKVSLMLENRKLLPNIRFVNPNSKIHFKRFKLQVQTEVEDMTDDMATADGAFVTSISSYGVGGSNVHCVVESAPVSGAKQVVARGGPRLFVAGTLSQASLTRLIDWIKKTYGDLTPKQLDYAAHVLARQSRGSKFKTFFVGNSLANAEFTKPSDEIDPRGRPVCFVFSGQGPQHIAMGRQLAECYPVFWRAIQDCDRAYALRNNGKSFIESSGLFIPGGQSSLPAKTAWPTESVVISLVFFQIALSDLIKDLGVKPDMVLGHSIGEIAMAYTSGALSKQQAVFVACARAVAMTSVTGNGSMAALGCSRPGAAFLIKSVLKQEGVTDGLWIAAENSPSAVTVAGTDALIAKCIAMAAEKEIFARTIRVSCAFHTPLMSPAEQLYKSALREHVYVEGADFTPSVPIVSTVQGQSMTGPLDEEYLWANILKPVLFRPAINEVLKKNPNTIFIEISPHPVLAAYIAECQGTCISVARRDNPKTPEKNKPEPTELLTGLGTLLTSGYHGADHRRLFGTPEKEDITPPVYPYNKMRVWLEDPQNLWYRLREAEAPLCESRFMLSTSTHPTLSGHKILGTTVFAASGYVDSILQYGATVVSGIAFDKVLLVPEGDDQTSVGLRVTGNSWSFRSASGEQRTMSGPTHDLEHATGTWSSSPISVREADLHCDPIKPYGNPDVLRHTTGEELYKLLPKGYQYDSFFGSLMTDIYQVGDFGESFTEAVFWARIEVPCVLVGQGYVVHPAVFDSMLQVGLANRMDFDTNEFFSNGIALPASIKYVARHDGREGGQSMDEEFACGFVWVRVNVTESSFTSSTADFNMYSGETGKLLLSVKSMHVETVPEEVPTPVAKGYSQARGTMVWQPKRFLERSGFEDASNISRLFRQILDAACAQPYGRRVIRVLEYNSGLANVLGQVDALLVEKSDEGLTVEWVYANADFDACAQAASDINHKFIKVVHLTEGSITEQNLQEGFDIFVCGETDSTTLEDAKKMIVSGGLVMCANPERRRDDMVSDFKECGYLDAVSAASMGLAWARFEHPHVEIAGVEVTQELFVHHEFGKEGKLVSTVNRLKQELPATVWVLVSDTPEGGAGLGILAVLKLEVPSWNSRAVVFEDETKTPAERVEAIKQLCKERSNELEMHMKITKSGDLLVRRVVAALVSGKGAPKRPQSQHAVSLVDLRSPTYLFPERVKSGIVELAVQAIRLPSDLSVNSTYSFRGVVTSEGSSMLPAGTQVIGFTDQPRATVLTLQESHLTPVEDSVFEEDNLLELPFAYSSAWLGLVGKSGRPNDAKKVVRIHNGSTDIAKSATKICHQLGWDVLVIVSDEESSAALQNFAGISSDSVCVASSTDDWELAAEEFLRRVGVAAFDCALLPPGGAEIASAGDLLASDGHLICFRNHDRNRSVRVDSVSSVSWIDVESFRMANAESYHALIQESAIRNSGSACSVRKIPFANLPTDLPDCTVEISIDHENLESLASWSSVSVLDPRKSYILVGGCTAFGAKMCKWMVEAGARYIILTSRRGAQALTLADHYYLRHLHMQYGAVIEPYALDARDVPGTRSMLEHAREHGPIGGVMLMSVVLRDNLVRKLRQSAFTDTYNAKVGAWNALREALDPADVDFIILFSSVASVFGNAGQAAYCAAQSYFDRLAEDHPNVISLAVPPILDVGIFKRTLKRADAAGSAKLAKIGATCAGFCSFLADAVTRNISHYVPLLRAQELQNVIIGMPRLLVDHLIPYDREDMQASNDTADIVAECVCKVLGIKPDQLPEEVTLPSLGLDSIAASVLSGKLALIGIKVSQLQLLGKLTLQDLRRMQVLAEDNQVAAGESGDLLGAPTSDLTAHPMRGEYNSTALTAYTSPASSHQLRLWITQHINETAYNEGTILFVTTKTLDVERLGESFKAVCNRHGGLRTVFKWDAAEARLNQIVLPPYTDKSVAFEVCEPGRLYEGTEVRNLVKSSVSTLSFDLSEGPLFRAKLFQMPNDGYALHILYPHIIADSFALHATLKDLGVTYHANGSATLPPPLHFTDFSEWLTNNADYYQEAEHRQFWAEKLDSLPALRLAIPQRTESAPKSSTGQYRLKMNSDLVTRFVDFLRDIDVGATAGFLAVTGLLLHKYTETGQTRFAVGMPFTDRSMDPALFDVVGFFVNQLPVCYDINVHASLKTHLETVNAFLLSAMDSSHIPFNEIVAAAPGLEDNRNIFRHSFTYSPPATGEGISEGVVAAFEATAFELAYYHSSVSKYELDFDVQGDLLIIDFDREMYSEATIARIAREFAYLVESAPVDPEAPIVRISVVEPAELNLMLREICAGAPAVSVAFNVVEMIEAQVQLTPDAVALRSREDRWTFSQLDARSSALARILENEGVEPGDNVALCFDRSPTQIVSMLAVLKVGASFVPLDPVGWPAARREAVIRDCGAKTMLTDAGHAAEFEHLDILTVMAPLRWNDSAVRLRRPAEITPKTRAYVLYTSGTTGMPKGVQISHAAVANLVAGNDAYGIRAGTRVLLISQYTFDAAVIDIFTSLTRGGCLCLASHEEVMGRLGGLIDEFRINVIDATPTVLDLLNPAEQHPSLHTIVSGGERMTGSLLTRWSEKKKLLNTYGPTEACVESIRTFMKPGDDPSLIGRPIPGTQAYILDSYQSLLPIGVTGELFLGGNQLSSGYLGRRDLTKKAFFDNPFGPGSIYATGDLAKLNEDDQQVKLRGVRIETEEISQTIRNYPGVKAACTVVQQIGKSQHLVAFAVIEKKHMILQSERQIESSILEHASQTLPRHMVPMRVVFLEALPVTTSYKVDTDALPHITNVRKAGNTENQVSPRSDTEKKLFDIITNALDFHDFGVTQNLFALGFHSLLAVRVISLIVTAFGFQLSLRDFMSSPTIAEIATLITGEDRLVSHADRLDEHSVFPLPEGATVVASPSQTQLWKGQIRGGSAYNVVTLCRFREQIDSEILQHAIRAVFERHAIFRTTYRPTAKGVLLQEPGRGRSAEVIVTAFGGNDESAWEQVLAQVYKDNASPFDLSEGPVAHASIFTWNAGQGTALCISTHHVATDEWSIAVVENEISQVYHAMKHNAEAHLPPLQYQYADWAVWAARHSETQRPTEEAFWAAHLQDVLPVRLPAPVRSASSKCMYHIRVIERKSTIKFMDALKVAGATSFMGYLACFFVVLGQISDTQELCAGTPVTLRNMPETLEMVGAFINTIPLRATVEPAKKFLDLLHELQTELAACSAHSEVPFGEIVSTAAADQRSRLSSLISPFFAYNALQEENVHALDKEVVNVANTDAKFPFSAYVQEMNSGDIKLIVEYDPTLVDVSAAATFTNNFELLLEALAQNVSGTILELSHSLASCSPTGNWPELLAMPKTTSLERLPYHLSGKSSYVDLTASEEQVATLSALLLRSSAKPFEVLCAAFSVIMQVTTGKQEFCFPTTRYENSIETVAVISNCGSEEPADFSSTLKSVRDGLSIISAPALEGASTAVSFAFYDTEAAFRASTTSAAPFSISAYYSGKDLVLRARFSDDQFPDSFATMVLQRYLRVIARFDAGESITRYPIEVEILLPHTLFEQQVCLTPDATAVDNEGSLTSYAELNRRASALSVVLRDLGAGPGKIIAIGCGEATPDRYVAIIAAHKLGAAYVPLDPGSPMKRKDHMMHDADVTICVTEAHLVNSMPQVEHMVVAADYKGPSDCALFAGDAPSLSTPDPACCVLYSSGSTGSPKGIVLRAPSVTVGIFAHSAISMIDPTDRVLAVAPMIFDLHLIDVWLTLSFGAAICPFLRGSDFADFAGAVKRIRPTRVFCTPTVITLLEPRDKGTIKTLWLAGEPLPERIKQKWMNEVDLSNLYGPSECTTSVTAMSIDPATTAQYPTTTVGVPFRGSGCLLVNKEGKVVTAPGEKGEVVIYGRQLACEYIKKPELTAAAFIPHPMVPGERAYRSGDLAYRLPSGQLVYEGRIGQQVKLRGLRIELEEVEGALESLHQGTKACAVVQESAFGQTLVAFVQFPSLVLPDGVNYATLRNEHSRALIEHAKQSLPPYALPNQVVAARELPLGGTGKRDRKFLKALDLSSVVVLHGDAGPEAVASAVAAANVTPVTSNDAAPFDKPVTSDDIAVRTRRVIEELAGMKDVVGTSSLLENGLSSFQLIMLVSKLSSEFELPITIADIMAATSLDELVAFIFEELEVTDTVMEEVAQISAAAPVENAIGDAEDSQWTGGVNMTDGLEPDWNSMVPMKLKSPLPGKLILVHDVTGHCGIYLHLGAHLRHKTSMVNNPYLGYPTSFPSIEAMAAKYVEIVQPAIEDRLIIVGYSFGGAVVLEMAELLKAQGHKVERVVLLDAFADSPDVKADNDRRTAALIPGILPYFPVEMHEMISQEVTRNMRTSSNHRNKRYDGPVTLIKAMDLPDEKIWGPTPEDNGWSEWLSDLTIVMTPGSHIGISSPENAKGLADKIDATFDTPPSVPLPKTELPSEPQREDSGILMDSNSPSEISSDEVSDDEDTSRLSKLKTTRFAEGGRSSTNSKSPAREERGRARSLNGILRDSPRDSPMSSPNHSSSENPKSSLELEIRRFGRRSSRRPSLARGLTSNSTVSLGSATALNSSNGSFDENDWYRSSFQNELLETLIKLRQLESRDAPARILCLHSQGANEFLMEEQMGALRKQLNGNVEFNFMTAPYKTSNSPYAKFHPGSFYNWTPRFFSGAKHIKQSAAKIHSRIRALGGVDGLLGVGEGATMAANMDALATQGLFVRTWRFVIAINAKKLSHTLPTPSGTSRIDLRSLHVNGGDAAAKQLEAMYADSKRTVIRHACGESLSNIEGLDDAVNAVLALPQEMNMMKTAAAEESFPREMR